MKFLTSDTHSTWGCALKLHATLAPGWVGAHSSKLWPKVGGGRSFARLQYCFVNNLAMVQLYPKMQSYNMCYHIMLCTYMFGAWGKDIVLLWAIIGRKVPPNHSPKHCFRKWLKALTTSSRVSRHLCMYLAHSPHQTSTSVCTFRSRFTYSVKQHPFCITLVC